MAKCIIKSQEELSGGISIYSVVFEADDGYQENQKYQCTEAQLKDALTHFNDTHLETKAQAIVTNSLDNEEVVLTVKSSQDAQDSLKIILDNAE